MQVVSKGMRATQLYLPNNPVYQRAVDHLRGAFRHVWHASDYALPEPASEGAVPSEGGGSAPIGGGGGGESAVGTADPAAVRRHVEQEAPPKREGLVSVADFDTTLYFLDDRQVEYPHKEVER